MDINSLPAAEQSQIRNLESQSGRSWSEWLDIVKQSSLQKHGELVAMLKSTYGIGHGYANMIVHHAKQSHAAASAGEMDWVEEQYRGKEQLKEYYNEINKELQALGKDIEFSPKKAYVSVRRKKQFAIIQPSTKTRLDVGLNLKGVEPQEQLEAAGSWNAMCTHRVKIEAGSPLPKQLVSWLKAAYEQAG